MKHTSMALLQVLLVLVSPSVSLLDLTDSACLDSNESHTRFHRFAWASGSILQVQQMRAFSPPVSSPSENIVTEISMRTSSDTMIPLHDAGKIYGLAVTAEVEFGWLSVYLV